MPASAAEAAAWGADAVEALQALDRPELVDACPGAALVQRLEALRLAMQAQDVRGLRRRVGLFGRLMGRDVTLAARADALGRRMGVLLHDADRAADALLAHAAGQVAGREETERACAALAQLESRARIWLDAGHGDTADVPLPEVRQALVRRLDHLAALQVAHGLIARQLALLSAQNTDLLARYRNIRDVLLPAWRQRSFGEAAAQGAAQAGDSAGLEAAIACEVEAMAGTLAIGNDDPPPPHPNPQQENAA